MGTNEFPDRLSGLMSKKGVSEYKIAHLCGVSRSTVWRWKKGTKKPTGDNYSRIADYFEVSVDFLMGRTDKAEVNR